MYSLELKDNWLCCGVVVEMVGGRGGRAATLSIIHHVIHFIQSQQFLSNSFQWIGLLNSLRP